MVGRTASGVGPRWMSNGDAWLAAKGIRTLRISAALVLGDVDDAVRMIQAFVEDDDGRV